MSHAERRQLAKRIARELFTLGGRTRRRAIRLVCELPGDGTSENHGWGEGPMANRIAERLANNGGADFAARARSNSLNSLSKMGLRVKKEELSRELDEVIREFSSNYEHHFDQLLLRLPEKVLAGLNAARRK